MRAPLSLLPHLSTPLASAQVTQHLAALPRSERAAARAEYVAACERHALRARRAEPAPAPSLIERLHHAQACAMACALRAWLGSPARGTVTARVGDPGYTHETTTHWGRRWSYTEHDITVRTPAGWRTSVFVPGLAVIDGLFTLTLAPTDAPHVYAATWLERGRGYDCHLRRGWIARVNGHSYHSQKSAADALRGAQRKAAPAHKPPLIDRVAKLVGRRPDTLVTADDAYRTGSCRSGVASWAVTVGLSPDRPATAQEVWLAYQSAPRPEVLLALRRALNRRSA